MKKIYLILVLVLVLSSSGIGVLVWSKKKKKEELAEPIVERPDPIEAISPPVENLKANAEIAENLITDISIDYIDNSSLELGYSMNYKGISHEGTFKVGDKSVAVTKSVAYFSVFTLNDTENMVEAAAAAQKVRNGKATKVGANNAKAATIPFIYLFIINKSEVVKALKVNPYTGEKEEGLPKDWPEFDGL